MLLPAQCGRERIFASALSAFGSASVRNAPAACLHVCALSEGTAFGLPVILCIVFYGVLQMLVSKRAHDPWQGRGLGVATWESYVLRARCALWPVSCVWK